MGRTVNKDGDIYDEATGAWIGVLDAKGQEQLVPTFAIGDTTVVVAGGSVVLNLASITNPITRDTSGRVTAYVQGGVSYVVTYGSFGVATITGGGSTLTQNYTTAGLPSGVTLS